MFDIIIRNGKKESYIKVNGNKLEGFNAINGVTTPLTVEEVNTINLLKLSDDKSYLGKENEYDVYLDNNSGLKHYFKDDKEDFEATWVHNGEDALIYKVGKLDKIKDEVKKIPLKNKIILVSRTAWLIVSVSFLAFSIQYNSSSNKSQSSQEQEIVYYNVELEDNFTVTVKTDEIWENITYEQIESCLEKNDNLTEEEKEIYNNKKLLEDIIPYYENTNMNILMPLKFDDLQTEYFYEKPQGESLEYVGARYNILKPNKISVNTYIPSIDLTNPENNLNILHNYSQTIYDNKAHEYIHLLQTTYDYTYIKEASAEIISCEYDNKCFNGSYLDPVKNIKILMEMIGPEPIWKLNFSNDETDLVNSIKDNLPSEKADKLIDLLNEIPGIEQKEGLDEEITDLLSQMYTNMYGEDMRTNPFIDCLLGNGEMHGRYYFNSDLIEAAIPYTKEQNFYFWHAYAVSNTSVLDVLNDIHNPNSEELYILFKNDIEVGNIVDITSDFLEANEVKFYCHGKEIDFDSINSEKYKNIPITYQGDVCLENKEIKYYPTIYESFKEQRINQEEFLNSK